MKKLILLVGALALVLSMTDNGIQDNGLAKDNATTEPLMKELNEVARTGWDVTESDEIYQIARAGWDHPGLLAVASEEGTTQADTLDVKITEI